MFFSDAVSASSCSYYSSLATVTSYSYSYATYTSCGFWGWGRCRTGSVKIDMTEHLLNKILVLHIIQLIKQHTVHKKVVALIMDHFLTVHVCQ